MRGTSVLVAGAGLAGLTAGRALVTKGAAVTVVDARDRVGGRVFTFRDPFLHREHAEAGADLIDESQTEICKLIAAVGLRAAKILPGGFTSITETGGRRRIGGKRGWDDLAKRLQSEVRAFCVSEQRWDGGVAESLARESVAQWLDRIGAPKPIRDVAIGLRGFFLADVDELSLLALTDQFAEEGSPGSEKMSRIVGGNDRLPAALAKALGSRVRLKTTLRRVSQTRAGVIAALESNGRIEEARFDCVICALPATTVRDVAFEPALPEPQRQAIATITYGAATKTALQFDRAPWRKRGVPRAFGTPLPIGAVWDGNENEKGNILTLLAGGRASAATQAMLAAEGPSRIVREMSWLNFKNTTLTAWASMSWEHERWSRGGYAFFDTQFPPSLRYALARPFERIFFAGEHTSMRWQGYMNGAVETGLRAAEEVAAHVRATRS
ncbi:MAG TPA: NAD(P)/FAD-dependent oxidoreductase [Vicinamibacterales bacterium]|nr:NAD(P)/FAD-dependent oxidoreductase [Vicinamibacterales bacterium]